MKGGHDAPLPFSSFAPLQTFSSRKPFTISAKLVSIPLWCDCYPFIHVVAQLSYVFWLGNTSFDLHDDHPPSGDRHPVFD